MAVGDTVPYGIKLAATQGSLSKSVTKIQIAATQGSINKNITGVWIAPTQGSINKKIFIGGGIYGDVNNDGVVDIIDYTLIRYHYEGTQVLTQENANKGDVNRDGVCNSTDRDLVGAYI